MERNGLIFSVEKLREYFLSPTEPNLRLSPKWLAHRLGVREDDLLNTLAFAVKEGIAELHWETYCPKCGNFSTHFETLRKAHSQVECVPCQTNYEVHLDRDVRVTFSASEQMERLRDGESFTVSPEEFQFPPTKGLDLLLIPAFRQLFSGEAPPENESLRIGRVTILFTDLRGSTAIYAERGDPSAYRMVRTHFDILNQVVERNRGVVIKTIGDSVMATFSSATDAVRCGLEAQAELQKNAEKIGSELSLKVGIHAGTCLAVNLNERLDFFGGAVNTAARLLGLSQGGDVVISEEICAEIEKTNIFFKTIEFLDSRLRGLPKPIRVHRIKAF